MNILAFDTSSSEMGVALACGGEILSIIETCARGQGNMLFPLCESLLDRRSLSWNQLDAIGVGIGPGNFTGIRISVSAARGLALGLSVPALGVSTFETTARLMPGMDRYAVPAVRGAVYVAEANALESPALKDEVEGLVGYSTRFDAAAHIEALACIATERIADGAILPAPLYVKPADAAPPKDAPPVLID